MIPAPFDYVRAGSVDDCLDLLSKHGDEAKILAGGHSLLPLMKLRLARPAIVIDIGRIDDLRGIRQTGPYVSIGAATTHDDILTSRVIREHCGILAEVAGVVADPQVRHRGTIGGALAHGDSAGDFPAAVVAADATLVVRGPGGERAVAAADFFLGFLETALAPDELLVEIRIPVIDQTWGWAYEKFSRVSHMWALVGACALVRSDQDGRIVDARIALTNMGALPVRASATEEALLGATRHALAEAAAVADRDTEPPEDLGGDADYRRHLARVLTHRALERSLPTKE